MRICPAVVALVVAMSGPVAAQHLPHGAREFFEPQSKTLPRVTPFAPHPADIFYEGPADPARRDLPPER